MSSVNTSGHFLSNNSVSQCSAFKDFDIHNTTGFPKSAIPTWIALIVINGLLSIPTFFLNLLVTITVLENKNIRSLNYNLMLIFLSIPDMLVGLINEPVFVSFNICLILQCSSTCNLVSAHFLLGITCSVFSLAAMVIISLERYLFIEHPLYYNIHVTPKKLIISTFIAWLLFIFLFMFGQIYFDDSYKSKKLVGVLFNLIAFVIIFFSLTKVTLTARRQMRAINAQLAGIQQLNQIKIKEYKRTFTSGILLLTSVVCFCPIVIIHTIGFIMGNDWSKDFTFSANFTWITFAHVQSILNPIVISLRLSYIRAGVAKKLCRQ